MQVRTASLMSVRAWPPIAVKMLQLVRLLAQQAVKKLLGKRGSQCLDVFFQISRLDFVRANRLRCFENLQEALGAVIALPAESLAENRQPCFHFRQVSLEYIEGRAASGGFDSELVKQLHDVRPLHVCHTRTAFFIARRLTGQPHDQRVPLRRTLPASYP
jgi:hypothetical protein